MEQKTENLSTSSQEIRQSWNSDPGLSGTLQAPVGYSASATPRSLIPPPSAEIITRRHSFQNKPCKEKLPSSTESGYMWNSKVSVTSRSASPASFKWIILHQHAGYLREVIVLFSQNQCRTENRDLWGQQIVSYTWSLDLQSPEVQGCYLLGVCDLLPQFLHLDYKLGGWTDCQGAF